MKKLLLATMLLSFTLCLVIVASGHSNPDQIKARTEVIEQENIDTIALSAFEGSIDEPSEVTSEEEEKDKVGTAFESTTPTGLMRTNGLGLVAGTSALIAAIGFFFIRRKEKLLRSLSMWALFHPRKTKAVLTAAQIGVIGSGLWLGKLLAEANVEIPQTVLYPTLAVLSFSALLYPRKSKASYSTNFTTRKTFDLFIPLSILVLFTTVGNQYQINPSYQQRVETVASYVPVINGLYKTEAIQMKPEPPDPGDKSKTKHSVGKIILAVFVALVVLSFLLIGSCALGCVLFFALAETTGALIAAIVVWAGGAAASVYAAVKAAQAVLGIGRKKDENAKTD